jgi:uncharacterized OB-fold protein
MTGGGAIPATDHPVDLDGVVSDCDGRLCLIGSRCAACATVTFPGQASCPRCGGVDTAAVDLPGEGEVWTWTVQRFPPKPPYRQPPTFQPFAVAYVDLGEVLVETPLAGKAPETWRIGDRVRLAVGDDRRTFWFEPADGAAAGSPR